MIFKIDAAVSSTDLLVTSIIGQLFFLKYYGLLTLIFFPLYSSQNSKIFKILSKLDQFLFKIKFFRLFAWSVLIVANKN